jgi:hypothetical protein
MRDSLTPHTDRAGVHAIAHIFEQQFNWFFRELHEHDFGIDAQVEPRDSEGKRSGKLLALQIKSGASYFRKRGEGYVYYGDMKHLDYWLNHSLPVFLILHDPNTGLTLWQKIERRLVAISDDRWSIPIPAGNTLTPDHKEHLQAGIASDPEAIRRFHFALDKHLMEEWEEKDVYFLIDDWVNKSLNIRGIAVCYDDPNSDADFEFNIWAARTSVHEVMDFYFPWLDYEYAEPIDDWCGEVERHILNVRLNEHAKKYLELERFFENGPDDKSDPEPPLSEEEEEEQRFEEARYQDWLADEREQYEEERANRIKDWDAGERGGGGGRPAG